ncbi:MAG: LemA family protein [Nitrospirae bacterium]|nr:LemA family protein [Nitrospirota bacterium]
MSVVWILAGFFLLLALWGICIYNRLVMLKNDVRNAWSQVDVQLKRRYDLIPNLVAAVKGFMEHEKTLLQNVVDARARAMAADRIRDRSSAEDSLTNCLNGFFAVMEGYPVLKSNENVMHLQEELVSTENRIAFSRQLYNDLVANYRTRLEVFPDMIISSLFSFRPAEYFSAGRDDLQLPKAALSSSAQ